MTALSLELASGSGPPSFTAITMSFPMRVKALDIADQRFIFLAFLNSKALPISNLFLKSQQRLTFGVLRLLSCFVFCKYKNFKSQIVLITKARFGKLYNFLDGEWILRIAIQ